MTYNVYKGSKMNTSTNSNTPGVIHADVTMNSTLFLKNGKQMEFNYPMGFEIKTQDGKVLSEKDIVESLDKEVDESRYLFDVVTLDKTGEELITNGIGARRMINILNMCFKDNVYTFKSVVANWVDMGSSSSEHARTTIISGINKDTPLHQGYSNTLRK